MRNYTYSVFVLTIFFLCCSYSDIFIQNKHMKHSFLTQFRVSNYLRKKANYCVYVLFALKWFNFQFGRKVA